MFEPGGEGPGNLGEEQVARLKAEMAAQFQGASNAGRPLLLEGGLKWQPMAFSPADMEFISAKATAAREIALAFGVPPMLLGIPGDNGCCLYSIRRLTPPDLRSEATQAFAAGAAGPRSRPVALADPI